MPTQPVKKLDKQQRKVVEISDGYHLVLAPPGCGKTHVLAQRVVAAQKKGVDFNKMLCLTFTNRAARNMRKKVEETISSPNISDLFVGNIHRFCSQFLYDNKIIPMNTVIMDEWDVADIVSNAISKYQARYRYSLKLFNIELSYQEVIDTSHYLYQISHNHPSKASLPYHSLPPKLMQGLEKGVRLESTIEDLKANYISITNQLRRLKESHGVRYRASDELVELLSAKKRVGSELFRYKILLKCAKYYNEYKRDNDLLDFDDLLIIGYENLKKHQHSNTTFSWIQIDEVQDLNPIQLEIIECVTDKNNNPCVIYFGDEQQAIYSFMGAAMESLNTLKDKCTPNIHHFGINYRSPKYLLDLYNQYAINILGIDPVLLPKPKPDGQQEKRDLDIILKEYFRKIHQNKKLHSLLNYYMNLDANEKIAILTSSNKDADSVSRILSGGEDVIDEETGETQKEYPIISHVKISGRDFFSTPDMKTFLAHFNVVNFETNLLAWSQLLTHFNKTNNYKRWLIEERTNKDTHQKYFVRRCPCCNKIYETARRTQCFCSNKCESDCNDIKSLMFKMRNIGMTPADIILERRYIKDFCENYKRDTFVIFDTETTGLNVFEDDIIQIAAIKLKKGEIIEKFDVVIRTDRTIPTMLGKEVNPMVEVYHNSIKVSPQEGFNKFIAFVGDSPVLAHNLNYDYNILKQNFIRHNIVGGDVFLNTKTFDSLKLIRLIRPKIKVYKLKNLIEQLELEGKNTHNAEDDIIATKSLADYCFKEGEDLVKKQDAFMDDEYTKDILHFFKKEYGDIYKDSLSKLYVNRIGENNLSSAIVENMKEVYSKLADKKVISKSEKFDYFINFLEQDIVESQHGKSLAEQLSRYLIDINTFKEADYCDSESMKERVFVSTVHKAKGLEFDNVVVLSVVEGTYPHYKYSCRHSYPTWMPNEEDEQTKEGARLLYVAISRAKKRLCVTHFQCPWEECTDWCNCSKYTRRLSRFVAQESIRGFFYPYPKDEKKE